MYRSISRLQLAERYDLHVTCQAGKQVTHRCSCTSYPPRW